MQLWSRVWGVVRAVASNPVVETVVLVAVIAVLAARFFGSR